MTLQRKLMVSGILLLGAMQAPSHSYTAHANALLGPLPHPLRDL